MLTVCAIALLLVAPTAAPASAADSHSYDFESPYQKLPFMAIQGSGHVLAGPAPGGKSGRAARVDVPNDGRSFKSEPAIKGLDAGSHRFSFANYLPPDWQRQDVDTIVAQWFSMQSDDPRIKPVVALSIHGGDWRLKVHWMTNDAILETIISLGAARLSHWNHWTFDIAWSSPGAPGSIAVTRDGVNVGSHQGANNYHRGEPPHFRIGAYRPSWRPEKTSNTAGQADVVLFVDDIDITSTIGIKRGDPPTATSTASPAGSPFPSTAPKPTNSPSSAVETGAVQNNGVPVPSVASAPADDTSPAPPQQEAAEATSETAGRTGVIGAAGGMAALAGIVFVLIRRRNATRSR
ncbi:heparin lyase I family protein (plasmid) [Embleya sp. NBC_00888]|uniref:heparin lyase I family protein n=1 Tax=Embleya sp. NBC_00888 TaxID=2975960 RepID=UPI002F909126|nr:heparin lyase I family protein [Embleya sp. NBC_00888]